MAASDPSEPARPLPDGANEKPPLAGELGITWDPDAAGAEKAKQAMALRRAAREQDRTQDLPGGRDGLESGRTPGRASQTAAAVKV